MSRAANPMPEYDAFRWSGGDAPLLDNPTVSRCGQVVVGRYGGTTASGAHKNEDAALVWTADDGAWTFAALLDAHGSSESADLVLGRVVELEDEIVRTLDGGSDAETAGVPPFWDLSRVIVRHLSANDFRRACAAIRGETALLLCAQKSEHLWWLSVGDIPIYVFHPEFAGLGQFALNQRMFFEWIGQVNTFALPMPCYTTGVRQLRPGQSRVLLTTDGLLECGARTMEDPRRLNEQFNSPPVGRNIGDAVASALEYVHAEEGRDSTTIIAWDVSLPRGYRGMQPSA